MYWKRPCLNLMRKYSSMPPGWKAYIYAQGRWRVAASLPLLGRRRREEGVADPDEEGAEEVDREEEAQGDIHEEAGDDVPPRVPRDAALVGYSPLVLGYMLDERNHWLYCRLSCVLAGGLRLLAAAYLHFGHAVEGAHYPPLRLTFDSCVVVNSAFILYGLAFTRSVRVALRRIALRALARAPRRRRQARRRTRPRTRRARGRRRRPRARA